MNVNMNNNIIKKVNLLQKQNLLKIKDIRMFNGAAKPAFSWSSTPRFVYYLDKIINEGFNNGIMCNLYPKYWMDMVSEEKASNSEDLPKTSGKIAANAINVLTEKIDKLIKFKNLNNTNKKNERNIKSKFNDKKDKIKYEKNENNNKNRLNLQQCILEKTLMGMIPSTSTYKVRGYCDWFNINKKCKRDVDCWFLHQCSKCDSNRHGRIDCRNTSKQYNSR